MSDIEVRVGQVWQDNDKRFGKRVRLVRVNAIVEHTIVEHTDPLTFVTVRRAVCEAWYEEPGSQSRTVKIRLDRFKPTANGYRLVAGTIEEAK